MRSNITIGATLLSLVGLAESRLTALRVPRCDLDDTSSNNRGACDVHKDVSAILGAKKTCEVETPSRGVSPMAMVRATRVVGHIMTSHTS